MTTTYQYKSKLFRECQEELKTKEEKINQEEIINLLEALKRNGVFKKEEEYDPEDNWSIVSRRLRFKINDFIDKSDIMDLSIKYVMTSLRLPKNTPVVNYVKFLIKHKLT